MVKQGSIQRHPDGVTIDFIVGDDTDATIPVRFTGIAPDLFREIAASSPRAASSPTALFVADEILAKHDENYMPPELGAAAEHKTETLRMIAEAGLAALWLAAALVAAPAAARRGGAAPRRRGLAARGAPGRGRAGRCWPALAFLLLIWLFLRTDLSVELVAANSHSAKPWLYKFAGAWGNHEGSMLLWVTVLAVAGGAVALFERRLPRATR